MRRSIVAGALALLTACGGPQVPLDIVGKAVPVNVEFGSPTGALPPVDVRPVDGGFLIVPAPLPPHELPPFMIPPPPKPPAACPPADPFRFPREPAGNFVVDPPPGAFAYRATGTRTSGSVARDLSGPVIRTVGNIGSTVTGALRYDVSEAAPAGATITSFLVDDRQLAITAIQRVVDGEREVFRPSTPLQLFPIPPQQTTALGHHLTDWYSAATDPTTQTTMAILGSVKRKARVNACGQQVDSWLAEIDLRTTSPSTQLTTSWHINVATQYGGLLVAESITTEGTRDGEPFSETSTITISEVPIT